VSGRGAAVRGVLVDRMTRSYRIAREVGIPKTHYIVASAVSWLVILCLFGTLLYFAMP
jgi:hypothetical protein